MMKKIPCAQTEPRKVLLGAGWAPAGPGWSCGEETAVDPGLLGDSGAMGQRAARPVWGGAGSAGGRGREGYTWLGLMSPEPRAAPLCRGSGGPV